MAFARFPLAGEAVQPSVPPAANGPWRSVFTNEVVIDSSLELPRDAVLPVVALLSGPND